MESSGLLRAASRQTAHIAQHFAGGGHHGLRATVAVVAPAVAAGYGVVGAMDQLRVGAACMHFSPWESLPPEGMCSSQWL
jgi:hypothetical protein